MPEGTEGKADSPQPSRADLLQLAQEEATARRPDRMLEALASSGFLDGLVRGLEKEWLGRLPRAEVEECVAVAVDSAYEAIAGGRSIRSLGAWLWKAASNRAIDRWNSDYDHRTALESETIADPQPGSTTEDTESQHRLADFRRGEAVRLARTLLPRIGQGQIVDVMTVVIDAVEQGIQDLPASAIADTLGLSEPAVRSLLSRGFERLEREARREGVSLPDAVPAISQGTVIDDVEDV